MVKPDYEGGSLVNLVSSIMKTFAMDWAEIPCRQSILPADTLARSPLLVLFICDSLGLRQLEEILRRGAAPNVARLIEEGGLRTLTSVFPTTTSTTFATFTTGLRPSQHGILGYRLWLEETGELWNMIRLEPEDGSSSKYDWRRLRAGPTVYARLGRHGVGSFFIGRKEHAASKLTSFLTEGAEYIPFSAPSEIPELLHELFRARGKTPTFCTVYWSTLDDVSHKYGPLSEPYMLEISMLDLVVGEMGGRCAEHGATLVLTADHGQTLMDPQRAVRLDSDFARLLSHAPAGGPRALYLSSGRPEEVATHRLLHDANLMAIDSDEAIRQGWFGGPCASFRSRLGELIVLSLDGMQVLYDYGGGVQPKLGGHSAMTEDEMLVPLIVKAP